MESFQKEIMFDIENSLEICITKIQIIYSYKCGSNINNAIIAVENFNENKFSASEKKLLINFFNSFCLEEIKIEEIIEMEMINNSLNNFLLLTSIVMKLMCFEILYNNANVPECIAHYLSACKHFNISRKDIGIINAIVDRVIKNNPKFV